MKFPDILSVECLLTAVLYVNVTFLSLSEADLM